MLHATIVFPHNVFKVDLKGQYNILGYRYMYLNIQQNLTLYHTTATFNNPEKEALIKTLWEKEKMLVTSIFSFSHNVF